MSVLEELIYALDSLRWYHWLLVFAVMVAGNVFGQIIWAMIKTWLQA